MTASFLFLMQVGLPPSPFEPSPYIRVIQTRAYLPPIPEIVVLPFERRIHCFFFFILFPSPEAEGILSLSG